MLRLGPIVITTQTELDNVVFAAGLLAVPMLRRRVFDLTLECARLRDQLRRLGVLGGERLADEVTEWLRAR